MFSQLSSAYNMTLSPMPSHTTYDFNAYYQQPQCIAEPLESPEFSYLPLPTPPQETVYASPIPSSISPSESPSLTSNNKLASTDPFFISVQGILPPTKNEAGRFECQLCDRSYTHAKHLKRHMMRHTGQKPYACSWCTARFTRPDIRKRHVSKCKVRRKMEGCDCIKIEEEDPAKAISLKNKKLKAKKAAKEAAAVVMEQKQQHNSIEVNEQTSLINNNNNINNQTESFENHLEVMPQIEEILNTPPLLENHVLSSPVQSIAFIPTPPSIHSSLEFKNMPYDQQLVFKSIQSSQPSSLPLSMGYMTPEEPAHMVVDASNRYFYYNEQQQQQPQHQQFFANDCMYGYSPLETFVPPVFQ